MTDQSQKKPDLTDTARVDRISQVRDAAFLAMRKVFVNGALPEGLHDESSDDPQAAICSEADFAATLGATLLVSVSNSTSPGTGALQRLQQCHEMLRMTELLVKQHYGAELVALDEARRQMGEASIQ